MLCFFTLDDRSLREMRLSRFKTKTSIKFYTPSMHFILYMLENKAAKWYNGPITKWEAEHEKKDNHRHTCAC